jgi:CheY-like chemotaxis protein
VGAEDGDRQAGDVQRLQLRIEELENQQNDAAQRHSQAVSLYMLELNQRSDAVHQRDLEIQKLVEQMQALEEACEGGAEQLAALRRERDAFEEELQERADAISAEPAPASLHLASAESAPAPRPSAEPARRPGGVRPPPTQAGIQNEERAGCIILAPGEELTVVHLEDHGPLRDTLRAAVDRYPYARYAALADAGVSADSGPHLLAVNLLAREVDPTAVICDPRWRLREPRALTYLAAGARGVVVGLVDFVPYPIEPDECATRLLERPGGTQRLLMVSDKIEVMNEIRAVLNRVRCSTSLALDGRQAFDLVGMVKPDAILIDLTLPRGEGLRLINRLRADPKTAGIGLVLALAEPFDATRFRADAARVLADCRFAPEDLCGALGQVLNEVQIGPDELRASA